MSKYGRVQTWPERMGTDVLANARHCLKNRPVIGAIIGRRRQRHIINIHITICGACGGGGGDGPPAATRKSVDGKKNHPSWHEQGNEPANNHLTEHVFFCVRVRNPFGSGAARGASRAGPVPGCPPATYPTAPLRRQMDRWAPRWAARGASGRVPGALRTRPRLNQRWLRACRAAAAHQRARWRALARASNRRVPRLTRPPTHALCDDCGTKKPCRTLAISGPQATQGAFSRGISRRPKDIRHQLKHVSKPVR